MKVAATTVGTYTYDYLGRRAKKVAGATTTYYAYGSNGLLYGEYTSTGTLVKEYVYLDSQPLAQIATGSPEVLTYLHTDNLGTPRYATNTAGTQVWAWPTDAFGISTPTGTVTMNLRFPGQLYDSESGLFYNWNRYYNPNIGRYISPDPIGQEGGLNLFSYVEQSPIMASDPMGLMSGDSSRRYMTAEDMMAEEGPLAFVRIPFSFVKDIYLLCEAAEMQAKINSGKILDRGGLTFAGRALQKHGNRNGSVFPLPKGNPQAINEQGQKILQGILSSRNQAISNNKLGGKDIYDLITKRGARFDGNGELKGFLEP